MPQRYQGSPKSCQCVSDKYSPRERFYSRSLWSFWGGRFKHGSMSKTRAELRIFWRPGRNALIRFRGVVKGGPKEERTYKCAKKLWKSGGYLFQSEQVTKQHVILNALNNFPRHADGRLFYFISFALKKTNKKKHCRYANTSKKNVTNIRAGTPQQVKPITADPATKQQGKQTHITFFQTFRDYESFRNITYISWLIYLPGIMKTGLGNIL